MKYTNIAKTISKAKIEEGLFDNAKNFVGNTFNKVKDTATSLISNPSGTISSILNTNNQKKSDNFFNTEQSEYKSDTSNFDINMNQNPKQFSATFTKIKDGLEQTLEDLLFLKQKGILKESKNIINDKNYKPEILKRYNISTKTVSDAINNFSQSIFDPSKLKKPVIMMVSNMLANNTLSQYFNMNPNEIKNAYGLMQVLYNKKEDETNNNKNQKKREEEIKKIQNNRKKILSNMTKAMDNIILAIKDFLPKKDSTIEANMIKNLTNLYKVIASSKLNILNISKQTLNNILLSLNTYSEDFANYNIIPKNYEKLFSEFLTIRDEYKKNIKSQNTEEGSNLL